MTKVGEMQLVTQSKSYLVKENYYQENSEIGYFHSTNSKLLDLMGLKQNQEGLLKNGYNKKIVS